MHKFTIVKPVQVEIAHFLTIEGREIYLQCRGEGDGELVTRICQALQREFDPQKGLKVFSPDS